MGWVVTWSCFIFDFCFRQETPFDILAICVVIVSGLLFLVVDLISSDSLPVDVCGVSPPCPVLGPPIPSRRRLGRSRKVRAPVAPPPPLPARGKPRVTRRLLYVPVPPFR